MTYPKLPGLTWDGTLYENEEMGTVEALIPHGGYPTAHAPAMVELPNGDLLCCWFAGTYEGSADVHIICSLLPKDAPAWLPPVDISGDPDPQRAESFPVLRPRQRGMGHVYRSAGPPGRQGQHAVSPRWCAARRVPTAAAPGDPMRPFSRRRALSAASPFRFSPTDAGSSETGSARIPRTDFPAIPAHSGSPTTRAKPGSW